VGRRDVRDDISGNGSLWSRHEVKYLVSESKAAAIAQFIRPYVRLDRYCKLQPGGAYPVVTLYLDSDNLQLCRESMQGHKNRFKLRIRSYTDQLDYPRFFEVKRRANAIIIKDRAMVMPYNMETLLSGLPGFPFCKKVAKRGPSLPAQNANGDGEALKQFQLYMASIGARPVVRTRYQRQAFESIVDNTVRVTFDRNVSCNVTSSLDVGLDGQGWHRLPLKNSVVLEIKFTGHYPAWLGQMVKYFNLRQQSVSKYVHSIKRASLLGLLIA
jgi:SPX domain protein involved in polyphosphate accumulation